MLLFGCKAHKHYAKQLNHSVDHYSVVIEFAPQGDMVSMKLKLCNGFYHLLSLCDCAYCFCVIILGSWGFFFFLLLIPVNLALNVEEKEPKNHQPKCH